MNQWQKNLLQEPEDDPAWLKVAVILFWAILALYCLSL